MRAFVPTISKLPNRTVLTVTTVGDPNKVSSDAIQALYMTAYQTKFKVFKPRKKVMEVGGLVARWPDAHRKTKSKWTGIWGLGVSDFVRAKDLLYKHPTIKPRLAKWKYGLTAQILHVGSYATEGPTVKKLHDYIASQGYKLAGPHEEEYLTRPNVKKPKTIIRYLICKA
ncbi:MAG: GyrI-like domain-containing protein [Candidatus Kerfeldbacteria bacterium]|nr:GyrI-like domain-containing protein [Candidatus Kerfeldbacteria bacterium]